jgi:SOS response regulatory protein OraA/RecX
MPHSDSDRQLGDKLMPKLISAIVQSVIATKKGLAGHEHAVRTKATQEIIDRMGHEAADHFSGLMAKVLEQENMHPELRSFLGKAATGDDQWQAAGQFLFQTSGIAGAFGQSIANAIAPIAYELNRLGPNLDLDPATSAAAVVRGIMEESEGAGMAKDQGIQQGLFNAMLYLAQTMPDVSSLLQMWNRNVISEQDVREYLKRNGFPDNTANQIMQLVAGILSPEDAALAVLRGDLGKHDGLIIAQQSGLDAEQFNILLSNTGEPPGAEELMEALRRKIIDLDTFKKGILQSRVRDEWIPTLEALRYSPISIADAVQAYVQNYISFDELSSYADQNGLVPGQIETLALAAGEPLSRTEMAMLVRRGQATEAEFKEALAQSRLKDSYTEKAFELVYNPPTVADAIESSIQGFMSKDDARSIAQKNGLDGQYFDALYATAGEPLSKTEMLTLLKRGRVSTADVKDALRQSRLKDAYIDDALELATELPALYETRALLSAGAITAAQGTQLLLQQGYTAEIVKAIVKSAIGDITSETKVLTQTIYIDLYQESAITPTEFITELKALGYTESQAELIRTAYDNKIAITNRNAVISKIRAMYTGRKITESRAQHDLNELGIPSDMVDKLMEDWKLILDVDVKLLTPAQVVDAWFMGLMAQGDPAANTQLALKYLEMLGYSDGDAMTLLEIKNKGPLTDDSSPSPPQSASSKRSTSGSAESSGQGNTRSDQ